MFKLIFHKKAKYQYLGIGKFIAKDNLFYANKVLEKINNSVELLKTFPLIGREIKSGYRQIVEPNYKFKIVYRVKDDTIHVIGIYREQNTWK